MATAKKWTDDETTFLKDFAKSHSVVSLAKQLDRSEKSIIAKLTSMGIYEKPAKTATVAKTATPDAKNEIISTLAILLGVNIDEISSLAKANKNDLLNLQQAVIRCAHFKDNKK